jgi:hypothetical protein
VCTESLTQSDTGMDHAEAQEGGGDQGGCPGRRPGGGGARQGVMGVRRQGCRQGNGELLVVWWVACGKNVKR